MHMLVCVCVFMHACISACGQPLLQCFHATSIDSHGLCQVLFQLQYTCQSLMQPQGFSIHCHLFMAVINGLKRLQPIDLIAYSVQSLLQVSTSTMG